jgi:hypothetical protein
MNLRKIRVVCALALGAVAAGCKSDCESACDAWKDCPTGKDSTDCGETCDVEQSVAETLGCTHQLDDLSSCIADVDDACRLDLTKQCTTESDALNACAARF